MEWIKFESVAYWFAFVASFLAVAVWESYRPKSVLNTPATRRWGNHGLLLIIASACNTIVLRISPVGVALLFSRKHSGLGSPGIPLVLQFAVTILLMDFVKYATHRLFHSIPWFWRVHQVHHSDPDFDVATAARAHPIETVATYGATLALVALTTPPLMAVIAGELFSVIQSMFQHGNVRLPSRLEALVRQFVITSDMHRIHHSEVVADQMSNYGEVFPWWDRLLGTYREKSGSGVPDFKVGIEGLQHESSVGLGFMLAEPFRRSKDLRTESDGQG